MFCVLVNWNLGKDKSLLFLKKAKKKIKKAKKKFEISLHFWKAVLKGVGVCVLC